MEVQYVAPENARRFQDRYPLAAETVLKSTYMDDGIDSVEDKPTAETLQKEQQELWKNVGMEARIWVSNSKQVMEAIPEEHKNRRIDGTLVLEEQLCRTCTYARSYMVRSKRVWNTLPAEMRRNTSLATFKTLLKQYYRNALNLCYDPEDARTWKSVCVKCNSARNLLTIPSCCFC